MGKKKIGQYDVPINSSKENMKDRKCDYKTLAIMSLYANFTSLEEQYEKGLDEQYIYLYRNKIIKFTNEIEKISKWKINTVLKNMRKITMLNSNLITSIIYEDYGYEETYYMINYSNEEGKEYVTIEKDILKKLINIGNSDLIKIYILIKYLSRENVRKISREYLAQEIGIENPSKSVLDRISKITSSLAKAGLIEKKYISEGCKTQIYYRIIPLNEFKKNHNCFC